MSKHKEHSFGSAAAEWINLLVSLVAKVVLLTVATSMLWALVPAALGWHVTTTMSGSMEPKVMTGDVVVSMPYHGDKVTPGQVILAPDPAKPDRLRFHRVLKPGSDGTVITKGDANESADSDPIKRSSVIGVGVIRVPFLGIPSLWMNTGQWIPFGAVVLSAPLLLWLARRDRKLLLNFKQAQREAGVGDSLSSKLANKLPEPLRKHRGALKPALSIAVVVTLAVSTVTLKPSESTFTSAFSANNSLASTEFSCLTYNFSALGVSVWNFNEAPVGTYATKARDDGDQFGDLTLVGATKKTGTCFSTDPYVTMNGSTSIMYGPNQAQATNSALSGYIRTSVKSRAMTIGTLSGAAGAASSANTGSSLILYLDANGKLNVGTRYMKYTYVGGTPFGNPVQTCMKLTYTATTNALNDGKWHTVSGSLFRNTNGTNIRMYVDGVMQNYNIPDTESNVSVDSLNSYVKWGYEPGMNSCMSGAVGTNPSRWSGDLDELMAGRTTSSAPDTNHP